MNSKQTSIHSLIVKIWRKDDASKASQTIWHGQVTHVPSGERDYSKNPDELPTIVAAQLRKLGVQFAACWRLRLWLYERRRRSKRKTS